MEVGTAFDNHRGQVPLDDREKARRTVARHATDVADASVLLAMLGLDADPEPEVIETGDGRAGSPCIDCGQPTVSAANFDPDGPAAKYGALGRCVACYSAHRRGKKKGA